MRATAVGLVALFIASPAWGDDAPWDFGNREAAVSPPQQDHSSLEVEVFDALVALYRDNKDKTSIHRCLFDVSCSHFAQRALRRYGLVAGSVMFVDRYFYRENNLARELYPLKGDQDGVFHLDDAPFLP